MVGPLAGVLIILVAVCPAVAVCIYNQRRKAVANPASALSQGGTDSRLSPTYSPVALTSELQHHSTASDPRRAADNNPQYALLGPTIASSSTVDQSQEYEEVNLSLDCTPPVPINTKRPRQPNCSAPIVEDTYSQPECKLPDNKELPAPSYSHLLRGSQTREWKEGGIATGSSYSHLLRGPQTKEGEGKGDAASGSSYSHLLHGPGGGDRGQKRETGATTQHMYSRLECDRGGRGTTQTGASESAPSHPVYATPVLGHAETGGRLTNPTYSPAAVGQVNPQHRTRRAADKRPQYAVLEGPTPVAPPNQPPDYETIDPIDHSPYSIPVPTDTDHPPSCVSPPPSSSTGLVEGQRKTRAKVCIVS